MRFTITIFLFWLFLFSVGCSAQYLNPGQAPAQINVTTTSYIDPKEVYNAMELAVGAHNMYQLKYGGTVKGPWWSIKAYKVMNDGSYQPLRSTNSNLFEDQQGTILRGARTFLIPQGQYPVEIWLETYIHYCDNPFSLTCNTMTIKRWVKKMEQTSYSANEVIDAYVQGDAIPDGATGKENVMSHRAP